MRGVYTSIQTHDSLCLCSPNCGCHAVSVVYTVNSLGQSFIVWKISDAQNVFGFPGLTSGLNVTKLE